MNRVTRLHLFIAAAIACFMAFCIASARCDDIENAKARLRAIEAEKQTPDPIEPVPDPISEVATPSIEFLRSMKSAAADSYFAFFTKSNCGPCERMKSEGVDTALINAGYRVRTVDIDVEPHPSVNAAPQVWLCDSNGMPIRKFAGYHTAAQILKPFAGDGTCRLSANGTKWSGVAIGDGLILTVAHHNQSEGFYAEFPASFGSTDFARVSAELVKIDKNADLSVLRYELPELVTVRSYDVSELPATAIEIPGYLAGETPKRVKLHRKRGGTKVAGIAIDSYDGIGISSPQFGMSGSPLMTPDKQIAGIQSIGAGSEVGAVTVDTIRQFLSDVERQRMESVANVEGVAASPETFAGVLAAHLMESNPTPDSPDGEVAYGSLFDFSFDAPETWKQFGSKLLTAQRIEFSTAGITLDWTGPKRIFSVAADRIEITPPVKVSLNKWLIRYSCSLNGVTYTPDLSSVTMLLTGAPDLTVNLK